MTEAAVDEVTETAADYVKATLELIPVARYRFMVPCDDYRPVEWPIDWPYWCSGCRYDGEDNTISILIAFAPDEAYIKRFWPDAYEIEQLNEHVLPKEITFSGRFPRPSWYEGPGADLEVKQEAPNTTVYIEG